MGLEVFKQFCSCSIGTPCVLYYVPSNTQYSITTRYTKETFTFKEAELVTRTRAAAGSIPEKGNKHFPGPGSYIKRTNPLPRCMHDVAIKKELNTKEKHIMTNITENLKGILKCKFKKLDWIKFRILERLN